MPEPAQHAQITFSTTCHDQDSPCHCRSGPPDAPDDLLARRRRAAILYPCIVLAQACLLGAVTFLATLLFCVTWQELIAIGTILAVAAPSLAERCEPPAVRRLRRLALGPDPREPGQQ